MLHNASIDGQLYPFFECLQDRNVVLICNEYMSQMKKYDVYCYTKEFNCFRYTEESALSKRWEGKINLSILSHDDIEELVNKNLIEREKVINGK